MLQYLGGGPLNEHTGCYSRKKVIVDEGKLPLSF